MQRILREEPQSKEEELCPFEPVDIYVLELEENNLYVGSVTSKRKTIQQRFQEHCKGKGAEWTKLERHRPIRILQQIHNCSPFEEDRYTLEYMSVYGIDKVRGGTFCKINFNPLQRQMILNQIAMAEGKCLKCKLKGHFIQNCPQQNSISVKDFESQSADQKKFMSKKKKIVKIRSSFQNEDISRQKKILKMKGRRQQEDYEEETQGQEVAYPTSSLISDAVSLLTAGAVAVVIYGGQILPMLL